MAAFVKEECGTPVISLDTRQTVRFVAKACVHQSHSLAGHEAICPKATAFKPLFVRYRSRLSVSDQTRGLTGLDTLFSRGVARLTPAGLAADTKFTPPHHRLLDDPATFLS